MRLTDSYSNYDVTQSGLETGGLAAQVSVQRVLVGTLHVIRDAIKRLSDEADVIEGRLAELAVGIHRAQGLTDDGARKRDATD